MQGSLTNIAEGLPFGWIGRTAMLTAEAGADVRGAMADAGVSGPGGLVDDASPIGPAEFLLMCRLIINAVEDEMHGAARSRMLLGTANMVVRAMASSRTLHEAIETAVRFFVIAGAYCRLELRVDEDIASLAIRSDSGDPEIQPIVEEMFMSFLHIQISQLLGFLLPVTRVGTTSPRHPGLGRPHPYMLGQVVRANVTGFSFPAAYLAFPSRSRPASLPRLEAELAWIARHGEARSGLANLDDAESRSGDVYRYLLVEDRAFDVCAGELSLTPPELRRDLWLEGSSFRQLRRAALIARARPLLREGQGVDDIAEALGYSDGRSFRRAVRAATGLGITELRDVEVPISGGARASVLTALRREEVA
ncbi:MAG: AraC family transcriptional regulator [Alphaproteobacteria bacterium]|nr:AraC family transcriptional regulator [Alphaproteobacteria bacterium]MBU1512481.1 AraC family transcriptional regulator [Alphaproteobacteria bacterium]MBU2096595.1 AraC family transcriptional regulator [Alphaproteobacteria bacterium]MBU2151587.1 AraC family transcriptional regulator [Alphaproteobacteria bacterium]MBU2307304.1 AraC family transcriptional regulator [Alphaproteobacteria bacterium]